jgi:phosphomannomutase
VRVLDGDICGYILASWLLKDTSIDPAKFFFITTIESDLMTAAQAQANLGLQTAIVSVGDKWIGHFDKGELLVGLENSGHLIFPIRFTSEKGTKAELKTGIGLLTGLMSLVAMENLKLSAAQIVQPFTPGFTKTYYVYFVDKSKFFPGSPVWQRDYSLLEDGIRGLIAQGALPASTRLVFEQKEDPNVLYAMINDDTGILGCIFMRNSGTEDKTATYVQGRPAFRESLMGLGKKISANHTASMKNSNRIEYRYETAIMTRLNQSGTASQEEIKKLLREQLGSRFNESDLNGVLYGLKKEERVALTGSDVQLLA